MVDEKKGVQVAAWTSRRRRRLPVVGVWCGDMGAQKKNALNNPLSTGNQEQYIRFYRSRGVNIFPAQVGTKKPLIPWKQFQSRFATDDEVAYWSSSPCNVAIVCGAISQNLVKQDFECYEDFTCFYENPSRLLEATIVTRTPHGGIHVDLRTAFPIHRSIRICAEHPLDILGEGGYALAAPSVIDHTLCDKAKCDRTGLGEYRIISEARTILQVEDLLASIKSRCARLGWKIREPTDRISEPIEHGLAKYTVRRKPLSKARMNRLVRNVAQAWIQGKRHQLALYLGGYFAKMGIREADAIAIVTRVCELTKDEESTDRILAVRESYTKPPDQVKGYSGLEELMAA